MPTIFQNKFDGGQAEDIRTFATDQNTKSLNFDVFTNPHLLQPYPDMAVQAINSGNALETYVVSDVIQNATGYGLVALGQISAASSLIKFLSKDANTTSGWVQRAESGTYLRTKNTLVNYKGLAYAMGSSGVNGHLLELTDGSTITEQGNFTGVTATCKPLVHAEDDLLYIAAGYQIGRYDGVNDIDSATGDSYIFTELIGTDHTIVSITNYGNYLAIGTRTTSGKGNLYLWNKESTVGIQSNIDIGDGYLHGIYNIQDTLIIVMTTALSTGIVIQPKLYVKVYDGGIVRTIKELDISLTLAFQFANDADGLYFASASTDALWAVTKNKTGQWSVTQDKFLYNGTNIGVLSGISLTEDILWVGFTVGATVGLLYSTKFSTNSPSSDYTATCSYKTTINPSMPIADRYDDKQLEAVQIAYTGASTGSTVLKYSVDGSAMTTIISDTNVTGEHMTPAYAENDGTQFLSGKEFQFQIESTGDSKIKEIRYRYKKLNESI